MSLTRVAKVLTLVFVNLSCPLSFAENCDGVSCHEATNILPFNPKQILTPTQLALTNNIREFCDESVYSGVGDLALHATPEEITKARSTPTGIYNLILSRRYSDSWRLSHFPDPYARLKSYQAATSVFGVSIQTARQLIS